MLVLLVGLGAGVWTYLQFLQVHRHLWTRCIHDRNTHYCLGLSLAVDLRQGDVIQLLHDLDGSRVWGPLHGILVALVQVIGGVDYRLGVLPSLLAWVGTALVGFLAARRVAGAGGTVAGFLAAILILGSPAHHAFAIDIMLESLGTFLSLLVLYLFLVAVQERRPWAGKALGAALTALFLCKANYWLLVFLAVGITLFTGQSQTYLLRLKAYLASFSWKAWLARQLRHPLTYPILFLGTAAVVVAWTGGGEVVLGGRTISIQSPHNLAHFMYIFLFLRIVHWWFRAGRVQVQFLEEPTRQLVCWHLWPVAFWFLLPKRLSYFLWYIGPTQGADPENVDVLGGIPRYLGWLSHDYHISFWIVPVVFLLIGTAILTRRRFRKGGAVFLWFVLLATLLTMQHPNRKSRFLHTWVPGLWVLAGVGLAHGIYGRWGKGQVRLQPWLSAAGVSGLAILHLPSVFTLTPAPDGGPVAPQPSTLELTEVYLPSLKGAERPIVLSNMPIKSLIQWTYLTAHPRQRRPKTDIKGWGTDPVRNQQLFDAWLKHTREDVLVYIHMPPGSHFYREVAYPGHEQLLRLLQQQKTFQLSHSWEFPQYGTSIYLWKRF